ncbi:dihydroorotase family protein [Candidatus Micrarchaeota archaeon]|nr:dihydroorotase family protein [Candidatus Micrarchaeota archaeon]
MSLVIKNGTAFINGHFEKKDICIEDGIITNIGSNLKADEKINATDMLVLPGLIDPHVHLREPGQEYKEDFVTGGRAAIAGGFTTVIDMPNNLPPIVTKKRFEEKAKLAKKALCDVLLHFGGTDKNFDEVKKADPLSLKLYLAKTTGEMMLHNPDSLEHHYENFPSNRPIVLHACGDSSDPETNVKQSCEKTEHAISLANKMKRHIHLAHASTKSEVLIAQKCKTCTVEVAPHHLFLSVRDESRLGPFAKVYPPLRSEQKRIYLWQSLEMVDCIATDHAPHTTEDKENGAAGLPGLETSLSLMLTACDQGLLDKIWVVQRMSENIVDIFNLKKKGRLKKGYAGDITIVDPKREWEVCGSDLETKCKWSPFEGKKLKGKVHTVIRNGNPVYLEYCFI